MDPRARWPDGTPVVNPFRPGSFRWSLIAEWWFWEGDTVAVMAEIMGIKPHLVRQAIWEVHKKTGWKPIFRRAYSGI